MPRFDLSAEERANALVNATRRKTTLSLVAAIAVLVLGMGLAYNIGLRANWTDHELFHAKEYLRGEQKLLQLEDVALQTQKDRLAALKPKGVPLARLMDSLAGATAPEASLTAVELDKAGRLELSGEAANERAIISTVNGLRSSPFFATPSLDSFSSSASGQGKLSVVQFQVSSQLAGMPANASTNLRGGLR